MARSPFDLSIPNYNPFGTPSKKKKRTKLTASEREYIWEHPKLYGRTCSICHQRITKISELQLDHTRAHSKGGTKLRLAHALCNRMKGNKSLGYVQKRIGVKTAKRKATKKEQIKRSKQYDPFGLNIKPVKVPNPFRF